MFGSRDRIVGTCHTAVSCPAQGGSRIRHVGQNVIKRPTQTGSGPRCIATRHLVCQTKACVHHGPRTTLAHMRKNTVARARQRCNVKMTLHECVARHAPHDRDALGIAPTGCADHWPRVGPVPFEATRDALVERAEVAMELSPEGGSDSVEEVARNQWHGWRTREGFGG